MFKNNLRTVTVGPVQRPSYLLTGLITDRVPLAFSPIQRRLSAGHLKVEVDGLVHHRYRLNRTPVPRRCQGQGMRLMETNQVGLVVISSDKQLDSTPQLNASRA